MLGSGEARRLILERLEALEEIEEVPLARAAGRVLAREVRSDVDLPPFEKSAMDGYAVHSEDFTESGEGGEPAERSLSPERRLPIVGESRAGEPFRGEVPRGTCAAIYTGAEVPASCDAVVMVERTTLEETPDGPRAVLRDRPSPMQNICSRGQDLARGDLALEPRRLRAVDLAVLAAVGCDPVPVFRRPRVALATTGDELVPAAKKPGPGQIREGNTLHLAALCELAGAAVTNFGILRDIPAELERAFATALESCDVLITTGGVSAGKYDLVGAALEHIGVTPLFHRVAIKPGKPLWFGMAGRKPVFALPGNPVSCLVNHELFVRPALARLSGEPDSTDPLRKGRWTGPAVRPNPREQFLPIVTHPGADGVEELEPVRWNGSADVVGIARARALAVVPANEPLGPDQPAEYRLLG
jgi:molybdopterin molybdotransferase